MINITYTSSDGNVYALTASMAMRLKTAKFHSFSWESEVSERTIGERVDRWKKKAAEYDVTVQFRGTLAKRREKLNAFHASIERDMVYNAPGRLTWGDSYISCFIRSSDVYPSDDHENITYNDLEIYCPSPMWIREQIITVDPIEIVSGETDINYNPSYAYSYSYPSDPGFATIRVDHYAPCDFRAVLHGPSAGMNVQIGNVHMIVVHTIPVNGYMVVDTRDFIPADKHCYIVSDGVETNCFNDRDPASPLLTKIDPGMHTVRYTRDTRLELTIFRERSEPVWEN